MLKQANQVREFHNSFNVQRKHLKRLSDKECILRVDLIQEELNELKEALLERDSIEVLDAIIDIMYLTVGTADILGLGRILETAFTEVHESNMSKLHNGKVVLRPDGKILKGENFKAPNLYKILNS
tara:strand:- start:287 stop:664 length:378 start_codon:yes stop_codon:yes gene_type:complete